MDSSRIGPVEYRGRYGGINQEYDTINSQMPDNIGDAPWCELIRRYIEGETMSQIRDALKEMGVSISQKAPLALVGEAWRSGRIRYVSPLEGILKTKFRLRSIAVAIPGADPTRDAATDEEDPRFAAVGDKAARRIMDILRNCWSRGLNEARIGFSGGWTMGVVANRLLEQVKGSDAIPGKIFIYGLTAGFDNHHLTAPNRFLVPFEKLRRVGEEGVVMVEPAGGLVTEAQRDDELKRQNLMSVRKDILDGKLDLIVTSAAVAEDEHSQLRQYLIKQSLAEGLIDRGSIGDMLWQPIADSGPIDLRPDDKRPISLVDLKDLPNLIRGRTRVLLVLTPCASCKMLKTRIAEALIRQQLPYITDLVLDCDTAAKLSESKGSLVTTSAS